MYLCICVFVFVYLCFLMICFERQADWSVWRNWKGEREGNCKTLLKFMENINGDDRRPLSLHFILRSAKYKYKNMKTKYKYRYIYKHKYKNTKTIKKYKYFSFTPDWKVSKRRGMGERGDPRYHRNCIQMSAFPPPKPSLSLIGCGVKTGEMSDVNIPQDPNLGPKRCLWFNLLMKKLATQEVLENVLYLIPHYSLNL